MTGGQARSRRSATARIAALVEAAEGRLEPCTAFLRDLVAIPSPSRGERLACERVARELETLGYDEVRIDAMGNVLGRIGDGPRVVAFDSHIDTVGITDARSWRFDPFAAVVDDGVLYGRGASDQKAGLAAMVYALPLLAEAGLPEELTLWVTATVMGEECVGLAWRHLIEAEGLRPEVVVIGMASHLGVCRGQRGRLELEIATRGLSTHGAHPDRGVNAIYRMAPVIRAVERHHRHLVTEHPFLGRGSVAVTAVRSESPSLTAIPDRCVINLDRRLTVGETPADALAQLRALPEVREAEAEIRVLRYEEPSWRGITLPVEKVFPAWETPAGSPAVAAALAAAREVLGRDPRLHRSAFSSNGCTTAGVYRIPTIGFGPGDEVHSHSNLDQVPLAQLPPAMAFYAAFPLLYLEAAPEPPEAG